MMWIKSKSVLILYFMKQALTDSIRMVFGMPPETEVPTVGIVTFVVFILFLIFVGVSLNL